MRDVYVVGIGITSFTRLEYPLVEIAAYPGLMALRECGLNKVDHLYTMHKHHAQTAPTWCSLSGTSPEYRMKFVQDTSQRGVYCCRHLSPPIV